MARGVSLKDFQESLAERFKAAAAEAAPSARLAFEAGEGRWLLRLDGTGEVLPVPAIERVPRTREWFLGVANVRGVLYGVSDFAAFLGGPPTARGAQNRLLLVGQPHSVNAALLVTRLAGLRNLADFAQAEAPAAAAGAWTLQAWRDGEGRLWRELDSARLVAHRDFLAVAVH
jgi:twitching motility protein PilI